MAAMSFSCCNRTAHFRYLFQKTTANPILDLGMITLPKRLHATRIRASNSGAQGGEYIRLPGSEQSARERDILELLDDFSISTTAVDVSKKLEDKLVQIKTEGELEHLYKAILCRSHISTMWKIAGAGNNTVRADPILPPDTLSPEKWDGMSCEINRFMESIKQGGSRLIGNRRFRLKGNLEMLICRNDIGKSGVIFRDKSKLPSGLLFVEKNPTDHPDDVRCNFAFKFGNETELHDQFRQGVIKLDHVDRDYQNEWNKALQVVKEKGPWPLRRQFTVYIRCIGSNVMVGQAWKAYGNPKIFGELLLVKDRKK